MIRIEPDDALAYHNRGFVYDDQGKFDEAIADYTEAIRIEPNMALAYYYRGSAYGKQGDKAKAEADFAKAKELGVAP